MSDNYLTSVNRNVLRGKDMSNSSRTICRTSSCVGRLAISFMIPGTTSFNTSIKSCLVKGFSSIVSSSMPLLYRNKKILSMFLTRLLRLCFNNLVYVTAGLSTGLNSGCLVFTGDFNPDHSTSVRGGLLCGQRQWSGFLTPEIVQTAGGTL